MSIDYVAWMDEARKKIATYSSGQEFEARQLFDSTKWSALDRGDKTGFGRYFSNEYESGRVPGITKLERGKDNHTRYRKL